MQYMPAAQVESPQLVMPVPAFGVTAEHAALASDSAPLQAGSENVVVTANNPGITETAENEAIATPTTAAARFQLRVTARRKPSTTMSYTIWAAPFARMGLLLKLFLPLLL
jgi:hypothetical protein